MSKDKGRPRLIRLNAANLREAIRNKEYHGKPLRYNQFGQIISHKEKDAAGQWVNRLFTGDCGVDYGTLYAISNFLGVSEYYITGDPAYMTEEERRQEQLRQSNAESRQLAQETRAAFHDFQQSPVLGLLKGRLKNSGVFCVDKELHFEFTFKENPDRHYAITPETLTMIENACADLCCSLIRNNDSAASIGAQ